MAKKEDKNLNKTYWEWQRYKQKETQRLLKKLTDQRKIHRLESGQKPDDTEAQVPENGETSELSGKASKEYDPYKHLKSARGIKSLGQELNESPPTGRIDEESLVGPYDDPSKYEATKAAASRAEKVVTKKRAGGRKGRAVEDMSLFEQREYRRGTAADDPKKKRAELIESLLDPLITLEDASTILNVCKTTVRRYTNKGVLDCIRTPGGQRRFKLSQVLEFMAGQEQKKTKKIVGNGKDDE